ncbi:sigma-70 family RNA polymerase sigma factor [Rummeliibacillus suwonensis]|uniref:sigma-70 family RNA polymerase sigma factor n=1 Tax=Rummeliibacillus suwonensis TaxID=1306154 RepID=UPI001AB005CD|nr:sigma-70 family RNA polymerase sigma factor [Rummeliibacillus suwonensis]MBO2536295.1 sigma-70 family RNA polymerase sigma factor [Rummeliibacillus suwonensis]
MFTIEGITNILNDWNLLHELIDSDIDNISAFDFVYDFEKAINESRLTERQLQVVRLHFIHGYSQREVGRLLGISQQAISKNINKATEKIVESVWCNVRAV